MSRRGRGEGSIVKRSDGRWQASYKGSDGRRHYIYAARREDVAAQLAGLLSDKAEGAYVAGAPKTVAEHLAGWLDEIESHDRLKPRTIERYRGIVNHHIVPALGDVKLHKVTTDHLDDLYAALRTQLSASSVSQVHVVLNAAMERARRRRLVPSNVVREVDRPKPGRTATLSILTPAEARRLLDATEGTEMGTLYLMALHTGMRQGEMLALRWQDVDLATGWIDVNATLSWLQGEWQRTAPKSKAGVRRIKMTPTLANVLAQHQEWQRLRHGELGHTIIPGSFVYTNAAGQPINGFHVTERDLKPLLRRLRLPAVRFHDLRHAFASLMLSGGARVDLVSKMLGHSKPSITLDIYAHLLPGDQEQAVQMLDTAFRLAPSVSTSDVNTANAPDSVLN